jgi:hypothetical protein
MLRACRRVLQRVRRIIAILLRFLGRYEKSKPALYGPSTNKALNVGASQVGTCPFFGVPDNKLHSDAEVQIKKSLFGCDLQANFPQFF